MSRDAYRDAGVDIDAGERLVERIKPLAAGTHRAGVMGGLGGFGGLFHLDPGKYTDPVLVSGTDGVGTKLLVAQQAGRHETIGVDLVAMCVNDIVVTGAEPLFFLDYLATGALDVDAAAQVIAGIAEGCRQAGCALLGGETAEMPGMYPPGRYDLAGFAVGVVERGSLLTGETIRPGDVLIGLVSSGLHSNGYSLARKIIAEQGWALDEELGLGEPLVDALLRPTRIYVRQLLEVREQLLGAAHITGGGILENLPRILPKGLGARLDPSAWPTPPLLQRLVEAGGLDRRSYLRTFNAGLGMILVVRPEDAAEVAAQTQGLVVGTVDDSGAVSL